MQGAGPGFREVDRADSESVGLRPLFLTGALTMVDYCERQNDEPFATSTDGPRLIAEMSEQKSAHGITSADMVFERTKAEPYLETDKPNPFSVHGATKFEVEGATRLPVWRCG